MESLITYLQTLDPVLASAIALVLGGIGYIQRDALKPLLIKLLPGARTLDEKDFSHLNALMQRAERNGCPKFKSACRECLNCFYNKAETK